MHKTRAGTRISLLVGCRARNQRLPLALNLGIRPADVKRLYSGRLAGLAASGAHERHAAHRPGQRGAAITDTALSISPP